MASYTVALIDSLAELPASEYAELEGPEIYPFLRYEWLEALELGQCLGRENGWIVRHLVVRQGSELVAFAPAYIKLHSYGEFVFDQGWAQASEIQLGVPYYPKLVVGIPFTPATAPRVLLRNGTSDGERLEILRVVVAALVESLERLGLSSVHVLFPSAEQACLLKEAGLFERLGVQYQYHRAQEECFEDFLAGFKSKRRAAIRRERREVECAGVRVEARVGEELTALDPRLIHRLYLTTVDKYVWGRRYLSAAFFERVLSTMPESVHLVLAKNDANDVLAGAFNLLGKTALFGRYWGAFEEVRFLHFEVCLYRGIQECIERGLDRFEAGAGGEHKQGRGLVPTLTRSLHHVRDARLAQATRDYCEREAEYLSAELAGGDSGDDRS